jgi:protein-disulfide isomerase
MTPVESDEEDLTRKQRREQARAQRKALEEQEAAGAARRKRLTQLGITAAAVIVVVVIIAIVAGGSGGGSKPATSSTAEQKVTTAVSSLLAGIPQSGNTLGSPSAPVTLQYFGDLECPVCKEFTLGALPSIIQKWVREGKVRIEYHNLETATREPEVFRQQQIAALAAGAQSKMWNYLETFYHEQGQEDSGYVNEAYLRKLAAQVPGLNTQKWLNDRSEGSYGKTVEEDAQAASNQGFNGTPSFLVGPTGGTMKKLEYSSLTDPSSFNEAIEAALKK